MMTRRNVTIREDQADAVERFAKMERTDNFSDALRRALDIGLVSLHLLDPVEMDFTDFAPEAVQA